MILSSDYSRALSLAVQTRASGRRVFFIGNGGSAAIASHMAADWLKNGGFNALCFNDPALLTCISNDLGYERVFALPLKHHAQQGDLLFAISSSGRSLSILYGVDVAKKALMKIITLSGFDTNNPLRGTGDVNFYVPSHSYGEVEIAHLTICHRLLDDAMAERKKETAA